MTSLLIVLLLVSLALSVTFAGGLRGSWLAITGVSLLLGATAYSLQDQQSADLAIVQPAPVSLVVQRNAFLGQFNRSSNWLIIADSYSARGQTEDAARLLQSAVRAHPRDFALWLALGIALTDHAHRLSPAARLAFARSAALAPTSPAPAYFLGQGMLRSGDRDGALRQWRKILAEAPANASWRAIVEDDIANAAVNAVGR